MEIRHQSLLKQVEIYKLMDIILMQHPRPLLTSMRIFQCHLRQGPFMIMSYLLCLSLW